MTALPPPVSDSALSLLPLDPLPTRHGPVPPGFRGVWRRTLLEGPGFVTDTRSTVLWLQTAHWHGDLRIPANRPDFGDCRSLTDTSHDQRVWLAAQQGFAGITEVRAADHAQALGVPQHLRSITADSPWCQWHRHIDFQPPRQGRDLGVMVFDATGDVVEEYGVDADYHETWVRLPHSIDACSAWQRPDSAAGTEWLLLAGNWFYHLSDCRPSALQQSLNQPSPQSGSPVALASVAALDLALCFGCWDTASSSGLILHATLPWLEGTEVRLAGTWNPLDAHF